MIMNKTTDSLLNRGLKLSHLRLLSALAQTGQLNLAAEQIGIAQPAASRLMSEIEQIAGVAVHERMGRGMRLTTVGEALAQRAQRVQMELRDAAREIDNIVQGKSGTVRIGSVTGPAIERVLPALLRSSEEMPEALIDVVVAPSDQLCQQLLDGQLDFVVGRFPNNRDNRLLEFRPIADEPVDLFVRLEHPLAGRPDIARAELIAYEWVMPHVDSLLGQAVMSRLRHYGMPNPPQRLATTSFLLTLAMIQQSNAIAPLAKSVSSNFSQPPNSPYARLQVDLGIVVETYGLVTLSGARLTAIAQHFCRQICA